MSIIQLDYTCVELLCITSTSFSVDSCTKSTPGTLFKTLMNAGRHHLEVQSSQVICSTAEYMTGCKELHLPSHFQESFETLEGSSWHLHSMI